MPTGVRVNTRVCLRVITLLKLASADTGTREPIVRIEAYPDIGSLRASGGVADDLLSPDQSDRRSGGARGETGLF
jgi:hypothetical protein